jgi:hypothetical protein
MKFLVKAEVVLTIIEMEEGVVLSEMKTKPFALSAAHIDTLPETIREIVRKMNESAPQKVV